MKKEDLVKLANPHFHEEIGVTTRWRVGDNAGTKDGHSVNVIYPYYDADQCREILDAVCGSEAWGNEYREVKGYLFCSIGIQVDGEFVEKSDAGGARMPRKNLKEEDAETFRAKTAASSAFVRAAYAWGIGRHHDMLPPVYLQKGSGYGEVITPSGEVLSNPAELSAYCNGVSTSTGWLASIYRANKNTFDTNPRLLECLTLIKEAL